MSAEEWHSWIEYRKKRGPFNPSLRMEAGLAQVCAVVFNAAGRTKEGGALFEPADFMKWAIDKKEQGVDELILEWARSGSNG